MNQSSRSGRYVDVIDSNEFLIHSGLSFGRNNASDDGMESDFDFSRITDFSKSMKFSGVFSNNHCGNV